MLWGCTFWKAIWVRLYSEIFTERRPVKMLVEELPKPAELLDTLSREVPAQVPVVGGPELMLLGLIFCSSAWSSR